MESWLASSKTAISSTLARTRFGNAAQHLGERGDGVVGDDEDADALAVVGGEFGGVGWIRGFEYVGAHSPSIHVTLCLAMEKFYEEFKVQARELVEKVRQLIHEGNVQRVIIKDDQGHTFVEIPVTVAAIGVIMAPVLAGVGAIAALAARFTIGVERKANDGTPPPAAG